MSIDDPFAEPADTERTVIRPNPGGRLAQPAAPPPQQQWQQPPPPTQQQWAAPPPQQPQAPATFSAADRQLWEHLTLKNLNPLVNAAVPLLGLAIRLKNRATHNQVEALRESVVQQITAFERRITPLGISPQTIRASKYALCATIDDLVLNTPWGSRSVWSTKSMVGSFFTETWGGDRFFDLLAQLKKDAAVNLDLLELLYFCVSLGFEGKYRVMPRGSSELTLLREDLYRVIRNNRGEFERELSPHWRGIEAAHRGLAALVPTWVILAIAVALLVCIYITYSFMLAGGSDAVFDQLAALPPKGPVTIARAVPAPPPPPPPVSAAAAAESDSIRRFLAPEIQAGLVTVLEDAQSITVRIRSQGMFASGASDVLDQYKPLLLKIGDALNTQPGAVDVLGHTDNQPIRTPQFPSNWHLSQARAKSVEQILASKVKDTSRLSEEGKADTEPVAPNDTPAGREQNRRIEIVITKTS